MHDFRGFMRVGAKRGAILLALAALLQFAAPRSFAQNAPKRPRITGIDHVRLYVSDMDASRNFYARLMALHAGGGGCAGAPRSCFMVGAGRNQSIQLEMA